jgi:hypothetical protein
MVKKQKTPKRINFKSGIREFIPARHHEDESAATTEIVVVASIAQRAHITSSRNWI